MLARALSTTAAKLVLVLLVVCLILWLWGLAGHASAERWEAKSIAERDNHRITKENVRAAQAQAAQAARAARLATEEQYRHLAERADHAEDDLAAARAAAARYADAHRLQVWAGGAAGSPASHAGAAAHADAAKGGDRPSADAVVIERSAFDQLVGNTLWLEQVRRWAQSLIKAGLAQAAD